MGLEGRNRERERDAQSPQLSGRFVASVNGNKNKMHPTVRATNPSTSRSFHSSTVLDHVVMFHRFRFVISSAAVSAAAASRRSRVDRVGSIDEDEKRAEGARSRSSSCGSRR